MNKFVDQFSRLPTATSRAAAALEQETLPVNGGYALPMGRGIEKMPMPSFDLPTLQDVGLLVRLTSSEWRPTAFLQLHTDDSSDPSCRIKINHGTTTLAFRFKGGLSLRLIRGQRLGLTSVIEINPYLLGTMAGGAGQFNRQLITPLVDLLTSLSLMSPLNPADCQYWETYLGIQCRLHELRNRERISVAAASKYLSNLVYSYKGMGLSMGTMICGWDKTGPALFYVDSDGTRLKGDLFSVGSGSTFAYGVLDQGYHYDLSDEDARELGLRSIYAAGHRDAFSGNTVNLFHVKENGWEFVENVDINELHYDRGYGYGPRIEKERLAKEEKKTQAEVGAVGA
ncbi:BQ5605_C012g06851 [Microbotryum silenes-dioicae]|uniref:proteasome endopeptidase complex n=1 Tax=Microbotryum silenes-dioicae TaxID=796604 RepID=A0A2X0NWF9_9BASI|nr:BQ5605_C012g06851 [Microbotryum silenes-dioicae]